MKKSKAFTLAEILITLGIIGIIAAITIPTLKTNIFEKEIVNKFKQSYSIISQAVKMMENEEECIGSSCYTIYPAPEIEKIASNIDKHFKYADKKCYLIPFAKRDFIDWLPEKTYSLDGTVALYSTYSIGRNLGADKSGTCYYKLLNGSVVAFSRMNAFNDSGILNIVIDANGKSGPNRVGKDMFPVISTGNKSGLIPYYRVHGWSARYFWNGLCQYNERNTCKPDEKSPAAYVLNNSKLPNLQKAGFPKNP